MGKGSKGVMLGLIRTKLMLLSRLASADYRQFDLVLFTPTTLPSSRVLKNAPEPERSEGISLLCFQELKRDASLRSA
jgi:hypothetical protein